MVGEQRQFCLTLDDFCRAMGDGGGEDNAVELFTSSSVVFGSADVPCCFLVVGSILALHLPGEANLV